MSAQQEFINAVFIGAFNIQKKTGIPAAVMVAQAIQETGYGQHVTKDMNTGQLSYNLFNIKGKGPAGSVTARTWEYIEGSRQAVNANFRAYHNWEESFNDYAALIVCNKRYAPAMAVKEDAEAFARALQQCGYATDPNYARSLIMLMKQWELIERVNQTVAAEASKGDDQEMKDYPAVKITVNGKVMPIPGRLVEDVTYAPIREIIEALGAHIEWDEKTSTVTVTK